MLVNNKSALAQTLNVHLSTKLANNKWLGSIMQLDTTDFTYMQQIAELFPYCIQLTSKKVDVIKLSSISIGTPEPKIDEKRCVYLIAMPSVRQETSSMLKIIQSIEEQSFSTSAEASRKEVTQRVALIMGMNTSYSYDSTHNENFKEYVSLLMPNIKINRACKNLSLRIVPFFWNSWKKREKNALLLTVDKCYMLLKSHFQIDPKAFEEATQFNKKPIPYQEIRNTIFHSPEMEEASQVFAQKAQKAPQYILSMDADFKLLNPTGHGFLSYYDHIVQNRHTLPSVMSTGYRASNEEQALIRYGIELDLSIRDALAQVFPRAVYMPEPNSAFHLKKTSDLKKLSWEGGQDMTTESRRLIANGISDGLFDPRDMVFLSQGAICTEIDEAWETNKSQKYSATIDITKKEVLTGLRGIHQSYAKPEVIADNIYIALGRKITAFKDAVSGIKMILGIFDPLTILITPIDQSRYSKKYFMNAMENYSDYAQKLYALISMNDPQKALKLVEECDLPYKMDLYNRYQWYLDSIKKLYGFGYEKKELDLIVQCARAVGEAIFRFLAN